MVNNPRKQNVRIPIYNHNKTTLAEETKWIESLSEHILRITLKMDLKTVRIYGKENAILRFILSESRKTVDDTSRKHLFDRIKNSVSKNKPIPISITVALGIRFPNTLKHSEPENPPTAAWLFNFYKLNLVAERVKRIYSPGIEFFLLEEGYILNDMFGISKKIVDKNLEVSKTMIERLNAPLRIISLLPEHFPKDRLAEIKSLETNEADIFAILCSLPEMKSRKIMDLLYQKKDKPFDEIKMQMNGLWDRAKMITSEKTGLLIYRKKIKLFQQLIANLTGDSDIDERILDAAVTEKNGRLSFRFTGGSLFSHGAAVLERNTDGKNSCIVVPEYKLEKGFFFDQGKKKYIKPVYMGGLGKPYIWAYEVI